MNRSVVIVKFAKRASNQATMVFASTLTSVQRAFITVRQMPTAQIHSAVLPAPVSQVSGALTAPIASTLTSAFRITSVRLARPVSIKKEPTIASVTLATSLHGAILE